jgi:hypothetical protein
LAPVLEAAGPEAVPLVRFRAAFGFPLGWLDSREWDGESVPLGGMLGASVALPFPIRRARTRVFICCSSPVTTAAKATVELLQGGGLAENSRG